jgi:hypothetical protein
MTQTNDVVNTLFANFPVEELGSEEQRTVFGRLKTQFGNTPDAAVELRNLYKVKGFSDFASVIMWILERSRKDPVLAATKPEDETLLLSTFRRAMVDQGLASQSAPVVGQESGAIDEAGFASLLDRFSEAVQSGIEGRGSQLESLFGECERISQLTDDAEFKQFGGLMSDFLKYIAESELLDDVRVINIVSNISSSVSQWAIAAPDARHGLMEEALGMLRDFKTHFE